MFTISRKKEVCGGKACIEGTRIRVIDIIERYKLLGEKPEDIASHYDIPVPAVLTAITYYYEHPDAIQKEILSEKALVNKLRAMTVAYA